MIHKFTAAEIANQDTTEQLVSVGDVADILEEIKEDLDRPNAQLEKLIAVLHDKD